MRRLIFALCLVLLASPAFAATYYVRAGASGLNNGSNWTNAYTSLPSLGAGNTYYLAEGSYPVGTVSAANVTIRRCVDSARETHACQSVTGWQDSYGDGQASLGGITIGANGITIDGAVRNESSWNTASQYGFSCTISTAGEGRDDVTVRYCAMSGADSIYMTCYTGTCDRWLVAKNYIYGAAHTTAIQGLMVTTSTFEYNYFGVGTGKEALRGQVQFSSNVIRFNKFYDACGQGGGEGEGCTAEVALWDGSNFSGNQIYGNWFWRSRDVNSGGTIVVGGQDCNLGDPGCSWVGVSASNTLVYNNTIAGFADGWYIGTILVNGGSGNVCRNNLWYNTASTSVTCNTTSNNVVAGSNPFVNYSGADLHLTTAGAAALATGFSLSSPYNTDLDGSTRGGDGKWDVGAYEYGSGGASPPTGTPVLSVRSLIWWLLIPLASLCGLLVLVPVVGGWLIRGVFDGRSDRDGGMGDVGGGEDGGPVRPLAPGAVQAVSADDPPSSGGEDLDASVTLALEHAGLVKTTRSPVVR